MLAVSKLVVVDCVSFLLPRKETPFFSTILTNSCVRKETILSFATTEEKTKQIEREEKDERKK